MLLTSPKASNAASPREATSSQASSAGSTFASSPSTASSTRLHTSSDLASNFTSPATLSDRASSQSRLSDHSKDSSHARDPIHPPSAYQHPEPPRSAQGELDTLIDACSHRTMSQLDSAYTSSFQPTASSSTSSTDLQHTLSTSPDSSRAPASKARRTSPGGSRASGDMYNASSSTQHSTTHNAETSRRSSLTEARRSHSPPASHRGTPASLQSASWQRPQDSVESESTESASHTTLQHQQMSGPRPGLPSPRSKVKSNGLATSPSTFDTGPSASSSLDGASDATKGSVASSTPQNKPSPQMNLAKHPPQELLKVLATLLHEIATANDEFQPEGNKDDPKRSRRGPRSRDRSTPGTPAEGLDASSGDFRMPHGSNLSFTDDRRPTVTTAALGALATPSSTLCFHARNVPSISIESYLLRILKYCPTTNGVFLSLLVYFDRMSRMGSGAKPGSNGDGEVAGEAAGLPRINERASVRPDRSTDSLSRDAATSDQTYTHPGIRGFAIDSYNVHRLVIAGITVASKFFSDVFYTNSRYAKVGGLPPHELNQLELQFLLLNDFRLTIPLEEMQRYADQLLAYGSGRLDVTNASTDSRAPSSSHNAQVAATQGMDNQGDVQMQDVRHNE